MDAVAKIEALEVKEQELSVPVRKEELWALKFLTLFYLVACVGTATYGYTAAGVHYEYNTIITPSFICLGGFLFCVIFLAWYRLEESRGKASTLAIIIMGGMQAVGGFTSFIAFMIVPGEVTSAVTVLLWILSGSIILHHGLDKRVRLRAKVVGGDAEPMSRCKCITLWSCRFLIIIAVLFIVILVASFIVNAVLVARDTWIEPLGSIYTVQAAGGLSLRMHLACSGDKTSTNITWVFEHGGGANSVSMKGLADIVSRTAGARTCVYDRLGYGSTPSQVTLSNRSNLDSTGELLTKLLTTAGEVGPFNCVGHSAGAAACLDFAIFNTDVVGVGFLDGYPDVIRAGSFRPGNFSDESSTAVTITGVAGLLVGSNGLLRGAVGDPGEDFARPDLEDAYEAGYAQSRFWFSQFWDLKADAGSGAEAGLYLKTNGAVLNTSLIDYGNNLDVSILVIPAHTTVTDIDCNLPENSEEFCCGDNEDSERCQDLAFDRAFYRNQAALYASTIPTTPGVVSVAPSGSEHGFPYSKFHIDWTANELITHLP